MNLLVLPLGAVTALAFAVLGGRAVRRLMGVDVGTIRMLVAGGIIVGLQGPLVRSVAGGQYHGENAYIGLGLLVLSLAGSAVIAMIVLVIAEALVPTGSVAGPFTAWRNGRGSVARLRRYVQIGRIVARHGLGPYVLRRNRRRRTTRDHLARSLRLALEDGGPAFVKFGQLLSTRVDLLPEAFIGELALLRDRVPPADWVTVEPALRTELPELDETFEWIDRKPLAAASIAQVHAAMLADGSEVVVKIQRPGAAATMAADLDILTRLARCLQRRTTWARRFGLTDLVDAYAIALREEFDFELEAANASAIEASARRASTTPAVRVPHVYRSLTTKRVLVMERLRGAPLGQAPVDDNAPAVARALLACALDQILQNGVFHADPHQGNIMLLDDGDVGLLDFGSVARIDAELRAGLRRLLLAVDRDDPRDATDALIAIVECPRELDHGRLVREVGRCLVRHLGPGAAGGAGLLVDLIRVLTRFELRVPPEVAAAFRAVATLEGVLAQWIPGFDVISEARAGASRVRMPSFGPADVQRELARVLPTIQAIPRTLERLGHLVESGSMTVRHEVAVDDDVRGRVQGTVHQVLAGAIGTALGFMALMVLRMPGGAQVTSRLDVPELLGYGLLTVGAILVTRSLVPVFRTPAR